MAMLDLLFLYVGCRHLILYSVNKLWSLVSMISLTCLQNAIEVFDSLEVITTQNCLNHIENDVEK